MSRRARRWCDRCDAVTEHWRDGPPRLRDPRFIIIELGIMLVWALVAGWQCRRCGTEARPWWRRK